MQRRRFVKALAAGTAAGALTGPVSSQGAPAIVSGYPAVHWRMASSFPKSLDTIYGGGEFLAARVAELTQNQFQIRVFAGGEIVPGLQVLDAVQDHTVECGHTASYYYVGKNKAFAFDTAMPFGLTARQHNAWMYQGGGLELMRSLTAQYGCSVFPGGNTGTQMGGWFRKEVRALEDLKGLKMRLPGIGGEILSRMGGVPQTLPGGEIYPALERGTIDATEWVGPYDDEKLGFYKVAPWYYFPGWWEGGAQLTFYVNLQAWNALPKYYRTVFEVAAKEANLNMQTTYDARNPEALFRLVRNGVKLRPYPMDIMKAAKKHAFDLYEEEAAKNTQFAAIYKPWKAFRHAEYEWFKLAEASFANFAYYSK